MTAGNFDPAAFIAGWEKSIGYGTEWAFWHHNGPAVIEFLREAMRAIDEGDWA